MYTHTYSVAMAAEIATTILNQNLINTDVPLVQVSGSCIKEMMATGILPHTKMKPIARELEAIFSSTRIVDGLQLPFTRVSITALGEGGKTDPLPGTGKSRRWAGLDINNTLGLSQEEYEAAYKGVWPLSEEKMREAMLASAFFFPSVKGFVHGSLVETVTGYHLDLASGRRWVESRKMTAAEREALLPASNGVEHIWVTVPQGAIAEVKLPS